MDQIASHAMGSWLREVWADVADGWRNYGVFGVMAWGLLITAACIGTCTPGLIGNGLSFATGIILGGVIQCGLCGVALARLHGREAEANDFQQDSGGHLQSIIAVFVIRLLDLVVLGVAILPGGLLVFAGVRADSDVLTIPGLILCVVVAIPAFTAWRTLMWFVVPLIVDKDMDFWSAMLTSADCARRDFLGLAWTLLLLYGLLGLGLALFSALTCSMALILILPFYAALQMRAYRDYFGLGEDRFRPLQITGYSTYGVPIESWSWERSARDEQLEARQREGQQHIDNWEETQRRLVEEAMEKRRRREDPPDPPK